MPNGHGTRGVDEQVNGPARFLAAFTNEEPALARVERPIDQPQIVAAFVGPVAVKLDASSAPDATVAAQPDGVGETSSGKFEVVGSQENLGIRERGRGCVHAALVFT